jgi:outer membrane protein TolC/ABC-type uncharacterized transport system substrate-binding protein
MNKKFFLLLSLIFYLSFQVSNAQSLIEVTVGIVHDGFNESSTKFLENLNYELQTLLGSKYQIRIPEDKILNANWSAQNTERYYNELINDENIDFVLGIGVISSFVIAKEKRYVKPVIVLGIINPEINNIASYNQNYSGITNFSYILYNQSISRDIDTFYSIYPFNNVGIVFFDEILKLSQSTQKGLDATASKNNTNYTILPIRDGIGDILNNLNDIDAVYLGHLGKFEDTEKPHLIEELTKRKIPTFGFSVKDVKNGALAAIAPEENLPKIIRRIALNIEAVLEGEKLSSLPVHITFEEDLTLNMETARRINFSPDFSIMSQAELLNEFEDKSARLLGLTEVMQEAVLTNLDIKVQGLTVESDEKEVSLAKSKYLPTLYISANGVQIDKNRAENSFGTQAERNFYGTASLQQLIFSEQAFGNISIQKHLLNASESTREQVKLDIMLETGEAYFDILQAQSTVQLFKDNIIRIKKNLEISKQRESVGYSSSSDVYRWESQLATETKNLIEAKNILRLTKIQMNRILNRPLDESFTVNDILTDENLFQDQFKDQVKNQKSLEILTQFLIEEAKLQSTEIQQINASIAAVQRSLESIQRQRYIPVLGLSAEADYIFSRSGAGSEPVGFNGQLIEPEDLQWYVGLNLSLPIFKSGEIFYTAEQTNIEILKLEEQKSNLVQNIEVSVRAAVLDLALTVANLDLSKQSADFANKSFDMVQDAYSKGAVSIVELTDAQTNMFNAEIAASNSVYEYNISLLRTQRAISDFLILKSASEKLEFSNRFKDYLNKHVND